jgi:cyanophycin synthetase
MAATAAAWALGVDWATIERGLASFRQRRTDRSRTLQRLQLSRGDADRRLRAQSGRHPGPGRRDRKPATARAANARWSSAAPVTGATKTSASRPRFSARPSIGCILYQDQCQRGRADGEVLALLQAGLQDATRELPRSGRSAASSWPSTARWPSLQAGDLCLILIDQIEEALEHIAGGWPKPRQRRDQSGGGLHASESSGSAGSSTRTARKKQLVAASVRASGL